MKTYRQTLLFIGKCLTLAHEDTHRASIEHTIINHRIDWDLVVKISTAHFVFPSLYLNLEAARLLPAIPEALKEFMSDVYDQNKIRNEALLVQCQQIKETLVPADLDFCFIKGVSYILDKDYTDLGERMIGDIDLLTDRASLDGILSLLSQQGYRRNQKKSFFQRNFGCPNPTNTIQLVHPRHHAVIAISTSVLHDDPKFGLARLTVQKQPPVNDAPLLMSEKSKVFTTIMDNYHNHIGYQCHATPLRSVLDVYHLSLSNRELDVLTDFPQHFEKLNSFLAMAQYITASHHIPYIRNQASTQFLDGVNTLLEHPERIDKQIRAKQFRQKLCHLYQYPYHLLSGWLTQLQRYRISFEHH